jgi:hypothetical protein
MLHSFEQADREGASDIGIHGPSDDIGNRSKLNASYITQISCWGNMQSTLASAATMLSCTFCMEAHGGCVGLVLTHVSLVSSSEARQMVSD